MTDIERDYTILNAQYDLLELEVKKIQIKNQELMHKNEILDEKINFLQGVVDEKLRNNEVLIDELKDYKDKYEMLKIKVEEYKQRLVEYGYNPYQE